MAYKSEKLRKKVKPLTLIIIGVIIAVIVGFVLIMQPSKQQKINKQFLGIELEDHAIEEITYRKLLKRLAKDETMIVFFGSPEDEGSRGEISLYHLEFTEEVKEQFKKIYFVNVSKVKEEQKDDFYDQYKIDIDRQPNLVYFKNNELVFHKNDTKKFPTNVDLTPRAIIRDFYAAAVKEDKAQ